MKELLFLTIVALSSRFIYGEEPLPQDKYPAFVTEIVDKPVQNMQRIFESRECEYSSDKNVLAWRMQDCKYGEVSDDLTFCAVSNEIPLKTEIDFTALAPSTGFNRLGFQYALYAKSYSMMHPPIAKEITSDPISVGMNYTFHRSARVPEPFQGKIVIAEVNLLDLDVSAGIVIKVIFCAIAEFFVLE